MSGADRAQGRGPNAVTHEESDRRGVERAAEWVYRGLWKRLSSAFKIPGAPPELPSLPGDVPRSFHPSRSYLRYLKLYFWVAALAIDALIGLAWLGIFIADREMGVILAAPALVLAIVPDVVAYVAVHLKYDTMWYVMNARSLRCRRGIWNILEHTITFENVQNVHLTRGPLQYFFGIWTIVIETAGAAGPGEANRYAVGNKAIMEGIDDPAEIRDLIMDRVRRSRGTGLGELPDEEGVVVAMWSPDHLRALREIREEIAGLGAP
ncbi:MAG: PH domain-containing protein [Gemmatimonadota bacterium]